MKKFDNKLDFLRSKPTDEKRPIFIYLPGMDGTGKMIYTQKKYLEKTFDIWALAISARDLSDWDTLSDRLIEAIVAELKGRSGCCVYLCGESFGGCLALKIATRSPELFERIILVNPASCFNQLPLLNWGGSIISLLPDLIYQECTGILLNFLTLADKVDNKVRYALLRAMQSIPSQTAAWRLSLLREFALGDRLLRRLTQPVLIVAGAKDRVLPSVEEARRLVSILPRAQMLVLPESGHACLLERDINLYKIIEREHLLEKDLCVKNC